LTVNPTLYGTTTIVICDHQAPFYWNSNPYAATGIYIDTLTSITGCDSIATLDLTVNPTLYGTTTIVICDHQAPFYWNSNPYAATGIYIDTLTSITGCDSIATLDLTVNPTLYGTTTIVICDHQAPFVWNSNPYAATGVYIDTLTSITGCDSIATLDLTVNPTLYGTTTIVICDHQAPFYWNSNPYAATGVYIDTLTSLTGCDSIATLDLTVNPTLYGTTTIVICDHQAPFYWNSNPYAATGVYIDTLTSITGCDSIATLDLTVNPTLYGTTTIVICDHQAPFYWNSNPYAATGIYIDTLTSITGCDSIATLDLTVNPTLYGTTTIVICDHQAPFYWNSNPYAATGIYIDTLTSITGCDSIATLDLTVNPTLYGTTTIVICDHQAPFYWNSNPYAATGIYIDTLTSITGCDSIATLDLTVNPTLYGTTTIVICDHQAPFYWNSNPYAATGIYIDTLTSITGCDSIATLDLTVNPTLYGTTTIVICDHQAPFYWNSNPYAATGIYIDTLTSITGCDSIATLDLTVNPTLYGTTTIVICDHQAPFYWNSNPYAATGIYIDTLTSLTGCDSIATLDLTVNPTLYGTTTIVICDHQAPFVWNSNPYAATGIYIDTLTSITGCDSIVTLNLIVNPTLYGTTTIVICDHQAPFYWNSNPYAATGVYIDTLTSLTGCDSIATLDLTVNPTLYGTTTIVICDHQAPFYWNSNPYAATGVYIDTLTSVTGCDSIATLDLTVNPTLYGTTTIVICDHQAPFYWNSNPYAATGVYIDTLTSLTGCDSIATLDLTVNPTLYGTTTIVICDHQAPFYWNSNPYAATGVYIDTLTSLTGCDSIATLDLTVNPTLYGTTTIVICDHQAPFYWNSNPYAATGVYIDTLTSITGCDSIATLDLTVNPTLYGTTTIVICDHQAPFYWNSNPYAATGIYIDTLSSITGCDSIATLDLTVNPTLYGTTTIVICDHQAPFYWNSNPYAATGVYIDTLTSITGCDSIVTLNLIVHPTQYTTLTDSICDGQTHTWNGQTYTATGSYTQTLTSAVTGCDSIVTLNLIVNPPQYTAFTDSICDGQTYTWHGQTYTATGSYTQTLTSAVTGCDSIVTLNLIVNPPQYTAFTDSICDGQTYTWHGQTYTATGSYTQTLTSAVTGCDSIVTLNLIVNPPQYTAFTDSICDGQTYTWHGQTYTATGSYTQTLTSAVTGCDSIVTLNLIVHPPQYTAFTDSICDGQTYTWNGQTYTATGSYTQTLTSAVTGCDSIVTLNLIVHPPQYTAFTDSICDGQTHTWHGQTYTATGSYTQTLTSAVTGCDSIVTLNLIVNPPQYTAFTDSICDGQTYTWHGQTYTATGSYTQTLTSAVTGCDSIVTLNLIVNPPQYTAFTDSICDGQTYTWHGQTYTATGSYTQTLTSAVTGCDSIVTLNLIVNPPQYTAFTDSICDGQTYTWHGQTYTATGSYTQTLTSAVTGCDSIVTLNLIVHPPQYTAFTDSICDGQTYTWNGQTYTATGSYTQTLTSAVTGCDSIVTLNLIVHPPQYTAFTDSICDGQTYTWNGQTYTATGSYTQTLTSAVTGCDSIVTLNLIVHPTQYTAFTDSICDGQTYTWNGQTYTATGYYTQTLTSAVTGCDSIVTLNLIVHPTQYTTFTDSICDGQTYTWHGQTYTATGSYTQTLTNAVTGCDSIVTLNLIVHPTQYTTFTDSICDGQTYTWNGQTYTATGYYTQTLTSAVTGCDSIVTLNLIVHPTQYTTFTDSICDGQTYTWNGQTYTATGSYTQTLTSAVTGCDSIVTLNLIVHPTQYTTFTDSICDGQTYTWNGQTYTATGSYTQTLTSAVTGCDSIVTLNLIVHPTQYTTLTDSICDGQTYTWNGQTYTATGSYTQTLTSAVTGCDSIVTLNLIVHPVLYGTTTIVICDHQAPYVWNSIPYFHTGLYTDTLTSITGCDSIATLDLTIRPTTTSIVQISICAKDAPYIWNGIPYYANGIYTVILTDIFGCDSIATLDLTINLTLYSYSAPHICISDTPYYWNGNAYSSAGIYLDTLLSQTGCDSIVVLHLHIKPVSYGTQTVHICTNDLPLIWNGNPYYNSGTFMDTLTGYNGCDSIITLHLHIHPTYQNTHHITICDNQTPIIWNGNSYTSSGTFQDTLLTGMGCDSIVTLVLTVNSVLYGSSTVAICSDNTPYWWNGTGYYQSGVFVDTLVSVSGCDSIVTLFLTVNPAHHTLLTAGVCANQVPYVWNGTPIYVSGIYNDSLQSVYGCDSIVSLHLTVHQISSGFMSVTICDVDTPFYWNMVPYSASGVYTDSLLDMNGCDSLVVFYLKVNPTVRTYLTMNVCQTDLPIVWNGQAINTAGTYLHSAYSYTGCDSIIQLQLNVHPIYQSHSVVSVCDHQLPYHWNGNNYYSAGLFSDTLLSIYGCDSVMTLELLINPTLYSISHINICDHQAPYSWNGNHYTATGIYLDTLTSLTGCDSIVTLDLTVNPTLYGTTSAVICDHQAPFVWNASNYFATGIYTDTLTSITGCDSIATLDLTINPTLFGSTIAVICDHQSPYVWNGNPYFVTGLFIDTLISITSCDSIVTLDLTVHPTLYGTTSAVICDHQAPFVWNASNYFATGIYTDTLTSITGCDSIVTLDLTITPTQYGHDTITICDYQTPFVWNSNPYFVTGIYSDTLTSAAGCDSIVTLDLTVSPTLYGFTMVTICDHQAPYLWNGNPYAFSGVYTDTLITTAGCDSIVTLDLHIIPLLYSYISDTICDHQLPYFWNSQNIFLPGLYVDTLISSAGCDSIITLDLTVKPTQYGSTTAVICDHQAPFLWNGNPYASTGIYIDTLSSITGCDSIITLNLTVHPTLNGTTTATICDHQAPFVWNSNNYFLTGIYIDTLTSITGCDSIASLFLTVIPTQYGSATAVICDHQAPFVWNGNPYTLTGIYIDTLSSITGCDSIITLDLTVNPTLYGTTTATICDHQAPFVWNANNYFLTGMYLDTLTSITGCDSIVTLHLTVNPTLFGTTTAVICDHQAPYVWNGNPYSTTGIFVDTLTSIIGCDSIATLDLTVNPTLHSQTQIAICDHQAPFWWNGNTYSASGIYVDTIISQYGCDSIVTLDIIISPTLFGYTTISICDYQIPFTWNGNQYSSTGIYTDTLLSTAGCDSIVTLNLTINPTQFSHTIIAICDHQTPFTWNGNNYSITGIFVDTLVSVTGCDSIATLDLSVYPTMYGHTTIMICDQQAPYIWNGIPYYFSGIYIDTLNSISGCDSIVSLELTVNPTSIHQTTISICDHQAPYIWNGNQYFSSGVYVDTLLSASGCDSILILNLIINQTLFGNTQVSICDHQTPFYWNGNPYANSGVYIDTLVSVSGCDSIVTLHLIVHPTLYGHATLQICDNQLPFLWNGNQYTATGTYIDTMTSMAGCHLIVTLNLIVNHTVYGYHIATVCEHQTPFYWNGQGYSISGTFVDTLNSSKGCDSIVTLYLTVNPTLYGSTTAVICDHQAPFVWNFNNYFVSGIYTDTLTSITGCDSIVTLDLTVNPTLYGTTTIVICDHQAPFVWNASNYFVSGIYIDTLTSLTGCDSIATLDLTVNPTLYGTSTIVICDHQAPYVWNTGNYFVSGIYTDTLTSITGCDSIATLDLTVNPTLYGTSTIVICDHQTPFVWNFNNYFLPGIYTDTLTSITGCDSIVTLDLSVNPTLYGTTTIVICDHQTPFVWNFNNYFVPGIYIDTLTSITGCDSVVTLDLTVNPTLYGITTAVICDHQAPFVWNASNYFVSGIYTDTLTSTTGCDSVVTLDLTVNPTLYGTSTIVICDHQAPYVWNTGNYFVSGIYTDTLTSIAGCDSIATLDLTVSPTLYGSTIAVICDHQAPYFWNGNSYAATGVFVDTLTSSAGCDSIVTLDLTVNPTLYGTTTIVICDHQTPFVWNFNNYFVSGIYTDTLTSITGCDSVVTLDLTVNPTLYGTTTIDICDHQAPFVWNFNNYFVSGIYTDTLTSITGCDSVVTLDLTVNPTLYGTTTIVICDHQAPFVWNFNNYFVSGIYTDTLTSITGCDSVVTLDLTVNPTLYGTTTTVICDHQTPFVWNTNNYFLSGIYTDTLTSITGCDSVVTLDLTVNPTLYGTTTAVICDHQAPYVWNTGNYFVSGIYTDTLTSITGCDSVVTLDLTVNPTLYGTTTIAICDHQAPFIWNASNYFVSGIYTDTLTSITGCDSVVTLDLTVNPTLYGTTTIAICDHQAPFIWNASNYFVSGIYTDTLTSITGCDSIVTLDLTVNPTLYGTTTAVICDHQAPFVWNFNNYFVSGIYTDTLTSITGCDSVVTLDLTVNPTLYGTTTAVICDHQTPFVWNTNNYFISGIYTDTLTSITGCDSVVTLDLTVNPTLYGTTTAVICDHQTPFVWNTNNYFLSGIYNDTLTSITGCDSVVTLDLTVNPTLYGTTTAVICDHQAPYLWNGNPYAATGVFVDTLTSSTGCDSVVTLDLTVNPTLYGTTTIVICDHQAPFVWNFNNYFVSGIYTDTLISITGCDSIATLTLTVNPTLYGSTTAVICDHQTPFVWNTNNYFLSGIYTDTLTSITGCDSVVTLDLTVNPTLYGTTTAVICDHQTPFVWNTNNYFLSGIYTDTLTSITGCDSVVTLDLTVNPTLYGTTTAVICDHQAPFVWNFNNYFVSGIYLDTLTSITGCDSVVTLDLTVNPTLYGTTTAVICDHQTPFVWNFNNYFVSGIYTDTLSSITGCDSVVTLDLTVNPTLYGTTTAVICDHQTPFVWNFNNYFISGIYTDTLSSITGCDSIVTLDLTVNPTLYGSIIAVICDNFTPYIWNGNLYSTTGIYSDTLQSTLTGCDSIVTLNLTVNPVTYSTTWDTICDNGLPYVWNGNHYTTTGIYQITFSNQYGCDSVSILDLTVQPVTYGVTLDTICDNQTYIWNGNIYTLAGIYIDTLTNQFGCDSVATLQLTVNSVTYSITYDTICLNHLPYSWNGNTYPAAGIYNITLVNQYGCDSIATLDLTVDPIGYSTIYDTICDNQLPYLWGGNLYFFPGTYTDTLTTTYGCDSLATLVLHVNPVTYSTTWDTICSNQFLSWNGNVYNTAGTYVAVLFNQYGCDSVATLNLHTLPLTYSSTYDTICDNQSLIWNGATYTIPGIYTTTLTNQYGCDSIATLHLTVNATTFSTTWDTICLNNLPYIWNGNPILTAGTYHDTLINHYGCDSITTLHLTVDPVSYSTTYLSICQNQVPFIWGGQSVTTAGTYTDTLVTTYGCDSVATLILTINPVAYQINHVTICHGQSYWAGGAFQTSTGVFHDTLLTYLDCDSIVTTLLTVNPTSIHYLQLTICEGDSIFAQSGYQTTSGTYFDTLTNSVNCDSVVVTMLHVVPRVYYTQTIRICDGDSIFIGGNWQSTAGVYYDTLISSKLCDSIVITSLDLYPVVFNIVKVDMCEGESYYVGGAFQTTTGIYVDTLLSFVGCDSIIITNLVVHPNPTANFSFSPGQTTIRFPLITFTDQSVGAAAWFWDFGDPDTGPANFSTLQNPTHEYSKPGEFTIWLQVTSPQGCIDSVHKRVIIEDVPLIYVPNAFTPDGDGVNDVFIPKGYLNEWDFYEFSIYNRYGQMLFITNDIFEGWNGIYNGELSMSGVYAWKLRVRHKPDSQIIILTGTVHLLR
jgi:gliding motility-associated-like protein